MLFYVINGKVNRCIMVGCMKSVGCGILGTLTGEEYRHRVDGGMIEIGIVVVEQNVLLEFGETVLVHVQFCVTFDT